MSLMMDRELGTLAFHARVLDEARNPANPLLEQARFLGIAYSGLQEFITVRLGALSARLRKENPVRPSGMTLSETLEEAWKRIDQLTMQMEEILHEHILPALAQEGIRLVKPEAVTPVQMAALSGVFHRDVMPAVQTLPLAEARSLPGGDVCMALELLPQEDEAAEMMLLRLDGETPALIPLIGEGTQLIMAGDALRQNLHQMFGGRAVGEARLFRLIRDAHAACDPDDPDPRHAVKTCLEKRARGKILRMICSPDMPDSMEEKLCKALKIDKTQVVRRGDVLNPARIMQALVNLEGFEHLKFPPCEGARDPQLQGDLFAALRTRDFLLCHPYDSFGPLVDLLRQAAEDRDVQSVHMTLYRVSRDSAIVQALTQAARRGVKVTVCVEPRARLDEERNLQLMDTLEKAGCEVIAGPTGVKVHGKVLLITREEDGEPRRYTHLGTGNYNEATACRYTDFGLMTADRAIGQDAAAFFAYLSGEAETLELEELTASPKGMRQELMRLIRREMEKASRRQPCGIACLLNALTDVELIDALKDAARCGVKVDLTVRGACCLRAGVPGETENVTVRSIVGRYLEHGRAFAFGGKGEETVLISSADWMKRSINRRIELLIPVRDEACRRKLLTVMGLRREENVHAWLAHMDEYTAARCCGAEAVKDVQERLMTLAAQGWPGD